MAKNETVIRAWLQAGRERGAGHMIVLRDPFGVHVPLYVNKGLSPRKAFANFVDLNGPEFDPLECYDFSMDLQGQLSDTRTQNWDKTHPVQHGNFSAVVPLNSDDD